MTLNTDPAVRTSFFADAVRILEETSPNFDLGKIAALARVENLVTSEEAEGMHLYSEFPGWLDAEFSASNVTFAKSFKEQILLEESRVTLSPPVGRLVDGPLTDRFMSATRKTPPMTAISGGKSTHHVKNFTKMSWCEDGLIAPMTDATCTKFYPFLKTAEATYLPGHTFVGVVEGSSIYTHWLLDTLPRLLMLRDRGVDLETFDHFLFATVDQGFHKQVLDDLNIPMDKVITRQNHGTLFNTDEFTFVSQPRAGFITHPYVYDMVGSFFGKPRPKKTGSRKIFVSRSKARRRRIMNEDEIMAYLAPKGYEQICLEDLSIRETAELMSQACEIVAPHGAGLANVVFAPPGTKVLEMFTAHLSSEYWLICNHQDLHYYAFETAGPEGRILTPEDSAALPFAQRNGLDMIVQMDRFRTFFETSFERDIS